MHPCINISNDQCINASVRCIWCIGVSIDRYIGASIDQCCLIAALIDVFDVSIYLCISWFTYINQSMHQYIIWCTGIIYQCIDVSMYLMYRYSDALMHQCIIDVSVHCSMYRYINWLIQKLMDQCINASIHLLIRLMYTWTNQLIRQCINWCVNTIDQYIDIFNWCNWIHQSIDQLIHRYINKLIDGSISLINTLIYSIDASIQFFNTLICQCIKYIAALLH